jgi:hypothetical protein
LHSASKGLLHTAYVTGQTRECVDPAPGTKLQRGLVAFSHIS